MCSPSRPPDLRDGSTQVNPTEGSEGDPPSVGASRGSAQAARSIHCREPSAAGGEPESPPCASRTPAGLDVFRTRTIFRFPRRSSSGYFSLEGDVLPSPPPSPNPATADKSTQTASPTGQVMDHALQRMSVEQGGGAGTPRAHGSSPNPSSTRARNAVGAMEAEAFGRQLRSIGDEYNRLLLLRRMAGRPRRNIVPLNLLPHIHQEPVAMLCVSLLLLLIGRLIYFQGCTTNQNHSQV
ncbi:uncharacterized protein LOC119419572 [Nematolebias whitei]|uniref:uncharacterized protein LOC119419572 n=1 Tax=Nematolebias whitei TaxID=451745 RepID=UPI0018986F37|nr:uncharacterized protein LOC119419572 [Nematolebias whitei]